MSSASNPAPTTAPDHAAVDEYDGLPVSSPDAGSVLPGDVLAWERLGVGHRCETWLAWSTRLWSPVVVKFPRPHQTSHPRARKTLAREVAVLARNLHPGLPRLFVDGTAAQVPHVVIEHLDGPAVADEIDEHGAFDPTDTAVLAAALLSAVRAVHARGRAHVDIKPDNVILRDGRPVLVDFGSARRLDARQPAGALIGSPGYAAPELEAGEPISTTMDVYGIGMTLLEMLLGVDTTTKPAGSPPASAVSRLATAMTAHDPVDRPDITSALHEAGAICATAGRPVWPAWASPTA